MVTLLQYLLLRYFPHQYPKILKVPLVLNLMQQHKKKFDKNRGHPLK